MYIKSATITNIRSIENFKIEFENPAGWHVLIGNNGSGKSTIIRSLALALVGPDEAPGLRDDPKDWLAQNTKEGSIRVVITISDEDNYPENSKIDRQSGHSIPIIFQRISNGTNADSNVLKKASNVLSLIRGEGWFSAAYGPYRRFSGGNIEWSKVFANQPRLGAHLSVFGEDVALTEPIEWLVKLNYQELERKISQDFFDISESNSPGITFKEYQELQEEEEKRRFFEENRSVIYNVKRLMNSTDFLPNNTKLETISSEGVFFKDGNGNLITVNQLSDGYRSILSLTFELIRQLIRVYGEKVVLKNIREDDMRITLPGVVLIDEIDAHLHPTWQTKIGQWFLKYFPNLQFIVTTHSPLVCRAAEKGTIWKLAAPGSGEKPEQITGIERDRLIYGNVLDAYGTEEFGIVDNTKAVNKKEELVQLSKKQIAGKLLPEEENKLHQLRAIFSTDATIEL